MNNLGIAGLIDAVIVFALLEGAALALFHRVSGTGVAPRDFALNMLSGLCLMFALRCLARDAGSAWIALFLLAAGIAHAADIVRRWQRVARNACATAIATATATSSEFESESAHQPTVMKALPRLSAPAPSRAAPPAA